MVQESTENKIRYYTTTEVPQKLEYVILHLVNDMTGEDARDIARNSMDFLSYEGRVPDSWLEADDKVIFNSLYDADILEVEYTEEYLYNLKRWNIYIWKFTRDFLSGRLEDRIKERKKRLAEPEPAILIYDELPDKSWRHGEVLVA